MKLSEIYKQMLDPLNDPSTIMDLIRVYSSSSKDDFYSSLVKVGVDNKTTSRYNIDERDKFFASQFNKWKRNVINVTKSQFLQAISKKILPDSFSR